MTTNPLDVAQALIAADRLLATWEATRAAYADHGSDSDYHAACASTDCARRKVEDAFTAMVEADLIAPDASNDAAVIRAHEVVRASQTAPSIHDGDLFPPLIAMEPVQYVGTLNLGPLGAITSPAEVLIAVGTDGRVTAAIRTRPSAAWLPAVDLELAP